MIWLSTFAFALAFVAAGCGAAALIISWRLTRALERLRSTTESALLSQSTELERQLKTISALAHEAKAASPTKLAAEVAALADAVSSQADTHRRFAGKVWARIGHDEKAADLTGGDSQLQALLALQSAAPRAQ